MFQNLTKSRREMEELSAALESLINGEDPALDRISEDTLPSKIQSQILRLQDKMRGSEQALAKEREEIRGLIADTAHQLRTPLANMESYLSLLKADIDRRTEGSERREEYGDLECGDSCLEDQEYYIQAITESEEKIRFLTEGHVLRMESYRFEKIPVISREPSLAVSFRQKRQRMKKRSRSG